LSKSGYLSFDSMLKFDRSGPIAVFVGRESRGLAQKLAIDIDAINSLTHDNALISAKIVLSLMRRVERYAEFFIEGRAAMPTG